MLLDIMYLPTLLKRLIYDRVKYIQALINMVTLQTPSLRSECISNKKNVVNKVITVTILLVQQAHK
jgi:hypothetical protein